MIKWIAKKLNRIIAISMHVCVPLTHATHTNLLRNSILSILKADSAHIYVYVHIKNIHVI